MEMTFTQKEINSTALMLREKIESLKNESHSTVVTLSGELGAGKTSITKALAESYGVLENVTSPTFVIMKKYPIYNSKYNYLIHIDAYRIEKDIELENLDWHKITRNPENLIILEWPERVLGLIPEYSLNVKLTHIDENTRQISF